MPCRIHRAPEAAAPSSHPAGGPDASDGADAADAGERTLAATVMLVEELGAEEVVHLQLGCSGGGAGPRLVLRTAGASRLAPGDLAQITVEPRRFRFFDAATGEALG